MGSERTEPEIAVYGNVLHIYTHSVVFVNPYWMMCGGGRERDSVRRQEEEVGKVF